MFSMPAGRHLSSLLLLLVCFACYSSAVQDARQGDTSRCRKQCRLAVKHKSAAKDIIVKLTRSSSDTLQPIRTSSWDSLDSVLNACNHGCLLFSICQFVNGNASPNASKDECHGACQEAYSNQAELEGCNRGCESHPSEAESRRRRLKALAHHSHPSSLMDILSSWCSHFINSAHSFISSTWTFYLQGKDGKVVVFQSQPEPEYTVLELQAPRSNIAERVSSHASSHIQLLHASGRQWGQKSVPRTEAKASHATPHGDSPVAEHDFLGCISRRSGLPRWLLAVCLFLSIMVMLWLSCASLVTAPDQHVRSQLCPNADKDRQQEYKKGEPMITVAVRQPIVVEEAGSLPVKMDLCKGTL